MVSTAKGTHTVLALLLTAFFIVSNQAHPSLGATLHSPEQIALQHDEMAQKSPTMRRLTWWKWGRGDKKIETTVAALPTTESSLLQITPQTTEKPSRWRSWFSSAKDKFSKAVDKVKTELKEAKESYDRGVSFVGGAAKEGIVGAGRAISTGAKTVGNATITAGRAIKDGANKFGSMVKTGFQKIRLKFSGEDEKFKIVANRLKDKLEAGDEKAIDLMKKLGINITYTDNKISGSHIENKNISVAEILQNEGILSNRSSSYHTALEQPEDAGPVSAADNPLHAAENDNFHSAEEYLDFVDSSNYTTVKVKHFNTTPTIYLPEVSERSSGTSIPTAMPNKTATQSTQTALPTIVSTATIDTDISEPVISPTRFAHISSISESTPIVPKNAGTKLTKVADLTTPTTSYKISLPSSAHPYTSESIIIPLISSSPLFSATSSSAATESNTLSVTSRDKTIIPLEVLSSESTTTFTDIAKDETPYPTSTSTAFTALSFSTHSTDSETELPTEITSITNTSIALQNISTTQTPSSTSISTSTITTTSSTSTSPVTTAAETTSTVAPVTFTTSAILTTTKSTTASLPVDPSTSSKATEVAPPIENPRTPFNEDEAFIEPEGPEDGGTLVEAEPYEPPPFPDIFSDIEVHDRLREFYDKGDFSHSEMIEIFNFDPDNYEYYDY